MSSKNLGTLNVPNLTSRIPFMYSGKNNGATGDGELPNITGQVDGVSNRSFYNTPTASGAFYVDNYGNNQFGGGGGHANNSALLNLSAYNSKTAYSRNDNIVIPRYLVTSYIIKY